MHVYVCVLALEPGWGDCDVTSYWALQVQFDLRNARGVWEHLQIPAECGVCGGQLVATCGIMPMHMCAMYAAFYRRGLWYPRVAPTCRTTVADPHLD